MVNTKWSEDDQRCTSLSSISFWVTVKEIPNEILLIPGSQNCLPLNLRGGGRIGRTNF